MGGQALDVGPLPSINGAGQWGGMGGRHSKMAPAGNQASAFRW